MIYPWLTEFKQPIETAYGINKLHHGILLGGQAGVGKAQFAQDIAQSILCNASSNQLQTCGQCKSCQLQKAGTHPDKLVIGQDNKTISVDEIRKVAQFVQSSAGQNANKVVIIHNAELMTIAAQNALLKTLEEPNAHRYLFLVSNEPMRLSATIRSRCLCYNLVINQPEQVTNWLANSSLIAQPWHILFAHQPLLLLNWHEQGDLNQLDSLYSSIECLHAQIDLKLVDEILKQNPKHINVFCIFLFAIIKKYLLNKKIMFNTYQECMKLLAHFENSRKTILGLNVTLATNRLIFSLQAQLNN
ncbi:hypothetical protein CJF42_11545 [Pseudoalteromonas sp. NBT06-2]|uniref:AAA family ATPase n=1 Tax=Pseudoalteromonas sp. NBT06-2 TaxID=2025950 RepID=UPI000BA54CA0|nr:AAA family ATPase [Pseudoalteromonas sp. NBT06-2]PAJ74217.1 hypothetical protein CJF42_11545 [Pseudoalteromonas sp. NBT06-2]